MELGPRVEDRAQGEGWDVVVAEAEWGVREPGQAPQEIVFAPVVVHRFPIR